MAADEVMQTGAPGCPEGLDERRPGQLVVHSDRKRIILNTRKPRVNPARPHPSVSNNEAPSSSSTDASSLPPASYTDAPGPLLRLCLAHLHISFLYVLFVPF